MHKHSADYIKRAKQFAQREILHRLVTAHIPLETEFLVGSFSDSTSAAQTKGWEPIAPGFSWGPAYQEGWYRVKGVVPETMAGQTVALSYANPERAWEDAGQFWDKRSIEGTVWVDGRLVGAMDWTHLNWKLMDKADGGEGVDVFVQTYAPNKETTVYGHEQPRTEKPAEFAGFHLTAIDVEAAQLYVDMTFLISLAEGLDEHDVIRAHCVRTLNDVCDLYDPAKRKTLAASRKLVRERLESLSGEVNHTITPLGHAHLDTAWLWPLEVTHLKMAHTTAIQLDLIERYPEYVFVHSQASQYEWLEKEHPDLLERIKRAIKKGQWEVVGSMWVEADCNLSGGESLVRQFLYGRKYFREVLGVETEDMWLPDVFGYAASLPQILDGFGIKYFLTQKMSWNQWNKIPHNTFWWQGIDGSKVWTHFPPADTYVADATPKLILESVKKHRDHGRSDRSMLLFGFGDGGGGPTEHHLELLRRARRAPGLPVVEAKRRALDFFRDAYTESQDLQTWVGELYLEFHRGTYTSQAKNKLYNRMSEFLLRDAELLCAFDGAEAYPADEIEKLWKIVLLNQFHDIIPGSSVREVYEDSDRDYAQVLAEGEALVTTALGHIGSQLDTDGMQRPVALFQNAVLPGQAEIPWDSEDEPTALVTPSGVLPLQVVEQFGDRNLIFATPDEALGAVCVADVTDGPAGAAVRLKATARRIENDRFSVRFDANGNITSIQSQDDEPIEFVKPGALANVFQIMDDYPLFWSAWDVEQFSFETAKDLLKADSVEVVERGPVRVAIETVRTFGKSRIKQRISLGPTPGIRFDTEVDWHEDNTMLKVAFPLNVHTDRALCEIQFGHAGRPTHRNTSWDEAKFEICAQKWVDVSEGGHGVALLNNGKYGHDILGDVLRLSLLRSPKAPDPMCDMGTHRFTYVLLPHYDQLVHSDVVAASYSLNAPVRHVWLEPGTGETSHTRPLVAVDDRNLVVESVKRAEDGDGLIVRLYECHGARGRANVSCVLPVREAYRANLEEVVQSELETDGTVSVSYRPFEILTLRLKV